MIKTYVVPRIGSPFPEMLGLPLISSVVDELGKSVQAPKPLIFSAVLSAISLALQGLVDVKKPKGGVSPCSLMLLCLADSGERKSTVDKIVLGSIKEVQSRMDREYSEQHDKWQAGLKVWKMKQRSIQRKIEKQAGLDEPTLELEEQYSVGFSQQPQRPKKFKMLYEDTTSEALFYGLYQDINTAGMITSEGGGVLRGAAFNDLSKQNSLWSGDPIHVSRISRESFTVEGARLTVSMMVQSSVFNKYMLDCGDQSRGSGLWARFLVCRPDSTQGQRLIRMGETSTHSSESFDSKLAALLSENISQMNSGKWNRNIVEFDDLAKESWVELFNFIEERMANGMFWEDMRDHASKLADNIARLAALFHCFEGGCIGGQISVNTLDAAVRVGFWYSSEFAKIFSRAGRVEADAVELERWLVERASKKGCATKRNDILRHGPNRLRSKPVLACVLSYLEERGVVAFEYTTKGCHINLYPLGKVRGVGVSAPLDRGW